MAQRKRDASPAHRRYRCRDGDIVSLACESEEQWRALAKCLGRPELAYPGSWQAARRSAARGGLGRLLEGIFAADPAEVWLRRLQSHGVPCEGEIPA
jgi:crotonobetainyl-CoA:carnitine CoA-transferase CaiB-like acyl-CoA transferase